MWHMMADLNIDYKYCESNPAKIVVNVRPASRALLLRWQFSIILEACNFRSHAFVFRNHKNKCEAGYTGRRE